MAADANVTAFIDNLNAISPAIFTMIGQILQLLLQPPLVIFTAIAVIYAGVRIGMGIWRRLRH